MNLSKIAVFTAIASDHFLATYACGDDGLSHEIAFVLEDENNQLFLLETSGETSKIVNEAVDIPSLVAKPAAHCFLDRRLGRLSGS